MTVPPKTDGERMMRVGLVVAATFLSIIAVSASHALESNRPVAEGPYLGQTPPGDTPVLFAPGLISTGKEHSAAMFTPDGNEVWFGRMFPATVYYMKRIENRWTDVQIAPFCDTFNYLYPVLAPEGDRIFFSSDRPRERLDKRLHRGQVDVWMVERTPEGWSRPARLNNNVNVGRYNSCGSTTKDGTLYFTAKTSDTPIDIFSSQLVNGAYRPPEVPAGINGPDAEHCPFVAPDGSFMIFSSFRGGQGRSDLFISFRMTDGAWSRPKNMGSKINSAYKDEYPYVSPDGMYLFFNSNRPSLLNQKPIEDGPGNIYWVSSDIIDRLRDAGPEKH